MSASSDNEDSAHSEIAERSNSQPSLDTPKMKKSLIVSLRYRASKPFVMKFEPGGIVDAQLYYLHSGVDSNFTIKCQDRIWKVNKGLLGQRCEYFRAAAQSGFSVRYAVVSVFGGANQMEQEQSTGLLTLDSEDLDIINVLLESIYTVNRSRPFDGHMAIFINHKELSGQLKHLISVVIAADMYLVPALVEAAGMKIDQQLSGILWGLRYVNNYMTEELFSSLLEALYPNRDSSAVEVYQVQFIRAIIRAKGDIAQKLITEGHMKKYPKLGLTVMGSMEKRCRTKCKRKSEQ
ncbi:hypothetical protein EPUS_05171 [Endocarpon pusillum Z07020]|uniref:BTB domain-containing protein n=1 Tax=Endocarpon pusillum (strain Z07020 / HMAS-L-300199) TaxID=1263415 RepID=U1GRF9_ENDPU|nr:uncharacterized protein EPUS_05171 [Endocarpon pusillum Z07020]ERF74963.1 hypothetical protein EPUS_05171 [Endocarpon pusillum Z07020]